MTLFWVVGVGLEVDKTNEVLPEFLYIIIIIIFRGAPMYFINLHVYNILCDKCDYVLRVTVICDYVMCICMKFIYE